MELVGPHGHPARCPRMAPFAPGLDPAGERAKGWVRPRGALLNEQARKANRTLSWLRQRSAKEKAIPVQEISRFPSSHLFRRRKDPSRAEFAGVSLGDVFYL